MSCDKYQKRGNNKYPFDWFHVFYLQKVLMQIFDRIDGWYKQDNQQTTSYYILNKHGFEI